MATKSPDFVLPPATVTSSAPNPRRRNSRIAAPPRQYAHPAGLPMNRANELTPPKKMTLFGIAHDGHSGMRTIRSLSEQIMGTYKGLSDPLGIRF